MGRLGFKQCITLKATTMYSTKPPKIHSLDTRYLWAFITQIQGDQNVFVHLTITGQKTRKNTVF
jgi:hypothetical protein